MTDQVVSSIRTGSDDYGNFVLLRIDCRLYSETAILKTAYWFTDRFFIFLEKKKDFPHIDIEFRLKEENSSDKLESVCGDFSNFLLDQEVRQRVFNETRTVRDTLIKKAFFEAKAFLPKNVISSEDHLPAGSQSYKDDPVKIGS
ncbi:His-Xaa-Ser system protein HxsD [Oxalobacter formigenes]